MPRNTRRKNYSLTPQAIDAIETYADEHDMEYSQVVENAVLEYTDTDRLNRVEQKIDRVLDAVESEPPASGPEQAERESIASEDNQDNSSAESIVEEYDYTADRDEPLTKDEINALLDTHEPHITAEHIPEKESELPYHTREKVELVAAAVRASRSSGDGTVVHRDDVTEIVKEVLGASEHKLKKENYPQQVFETLLPSEELEPGPIGLRLTDSDHLVFPTEEDRQVRYRTYFVEMVETIENTDETETLEMKRAELEGWGQRWIDLDVTTEDEIQEALDLADKRLAELAE